MSEVDRLVEDVERARERYLSSVTGLSSGQAEFRVDEAAWSIVQITEHLVHAETGGINLIWRALEGVTRGSPVWSGESPNRGLSIEAVVERTWRPREVAPDSALPRIGGPLDYWIAALKSCSVLLEALVVPLRDVALEDVIYPHVISGPLDARQRLQFLAFHLNRHAEQVAQVMAHPRFPGGGRGVPDAS